jgi:hypothetical protein
MAEPVHVPVLGELVLHRGRLRGYAGRPRAGFRGSSAAAGRHRCVRLRASAASGRSHAPSRRGWPVSSRPGRSTGPPAGARARLAALGRAGPPRHLAAPGPGPDVKHHLHPGRPVNCLDAPQDHDPVRISGQGERLPAFRPRRARPAAAPDEAAGLVIATPDMPGIRWRDRIGAAAAKEPGEDGGLSQRGAHSHEMAPSGPIRAPRSPSAIRAYSRSTCGRNDPIMRMLLSGRSRPKTPGHMLPDGPRQARPRP